VAGGGRHRRTEEIDVREDSGGGAVSQEGGA